MNDDRHGLFIENLLTYHFSIKFEFEELRQFRPNLHGFCEIENFNKQALIVGFGNEKKYYLVTKTPKAIFLKNVEEIITSVLQEFT
ncbi:hypothetical protein BpHYR1_051475 [Brachionus plicatilis]|uniref:Uncharacterized protein n=1 Tax=Brachionus plicatilis TaxID=10195 RepID=A0A3M7S2H8_BRAPC|nr:hypothetical protein BpHYR1_051475 [Brachionus plicatilis]